jgi:CubicO group peptidase (beta-lactamase class C family)
MLRITPIAVILLLASSAIADAVSPDPALAPLVARWEKAAQDLGIPGFAVVVVKDGKVAMLQTFGHADAAGNVPVTPDSAFYIASCTKTYTATAIMQLVEAGKIRLDDPVRKYLPGLKLNDNPGLAESLTVRDLLTHRHGIDHDTITFAEAYTGQWDDPLFWRLIPTSKIAGEPRYTNLHFTLAGRVVEAVSGKPWRDYLADHVFAPAGMTRTTGYASKMYAWPNATTTLIRDGANTLHPSPVRKADSTMHAAGGLGTSPRDAAAWMLIHLNNGEVNGVRILSPQSVAEMQKLQVEIPDPPNRPPFDGLSIKGFGLAWRVGDYRGHKFCAHGGGYVGARAHVSIMPDLNTGVFAMTNIGDAAGPFCELVAIDVYNKLLGVTDFSDPLPRLVEQQTRGQAGRARGEEEARNRQPVTPQTLSDAAQAAGEYVNPDWGTVRVEMKDGRMRMTWGELPASPTTTGTDRFECHFERVTVMAGRFEGGVLVLENEENEIRFTKK